MRDDDLRPSDNVEDRRGFGGGGGGFRVGGGLGIGTIIGLGLLGWALGINPLVLIEGAQMVAGGGGPTQMSAPQGRQGAPSDQIGNFVARVLGETEDVWSQVLPAQADRQYTPPKLVLFDGVTQSACGTAQSAMGPFYCPTDRKVYLDTRFFEDMQRRLGGGGDFAYAYVIAHEVGHHVENLLGVLPKVQAAQRAASSRAEANAYSVRNELMADCLAGVWAYWMNRRHANVDEADVRQAVATATAIGDDRLQRQAQGTVVPDSFTHGSAQQRAHWLTVGLQGGSVSSCDTFRTTEP
ncbi:MAG: neutral zinc metallopeptidase [Acetobacteraceae bacterium]